MAKLPFSTQVQQQYRKIPALPRKDLSKKTIVVIGANAGLGFEAIKHLIPMNPRRLIMGCRSEKKGKDAIAELESTTGYKKLELWLIDMSNFASVSAFADKFEKDGGRLDVLMMNAGIQTYEYTKTGDGFESVLQVNHLSTSLLPFLLTPTLLKTSKEYNTTPRIVIVSSEMHYWTHLSPKVYETPNVVEYLSSEEYCTPTVMKEQYNTSKLLEIMFARSFASKIILPPSSLVITTVNPGWCYTNVFRLLPLLVQYFISVLMLFLAISAEKGSKMMVRAAVCEDDEFKSDVGGDVVINGGYLSAESVCEVADAVLSEEGKRMQENVWKDTVHILSKADPRVKEIVGVHFTKMQ